MNGLEIIKANDIIEVIDDLDTSKVQSEENWIGFDLLYNNKRYSPRQVVSLAYSRILGKEINPIYSIGDILNVLRLENFEYQEKNTFWKLGCNWGKGAPSFYEFIKEQNIVIGTDYDGFYEKGDLILVTEGFAVRAIASVKSSSKDLINNQTLNYTLNQEYEIYNIDDVRYYDVEFFEIPKEDSFLYELQQGIVKVRKKSIKHTAIDLWDFRKVQLNKVNFQLVSSKAETDYSLQFPFIGLDMDNWNDYGFETAFRMSYYRSPNHKTNIGTIKIYQIEQTKTILPDSFEKLSTEYCSLGQTQEYYKALKSLMPINYRNVLGALRDIALNKSIRNDFMEFEGVKNSLLRSSEADHVMNNIEDIIVSFESSQPYNFSFDFKIEHALAKHSVNFKFGDIDQLINRFHCIVGKNGTGKTKFISQIANKLTDGKEEGVFRPARPYFSKIIAVSFSYFDKFRFPIRVDTNYEFIGIKDKNGVIEEGDYSDLIWRSYKSLMSDRKKMKLWEKSIKSSLESEYLGFNLDELRGLSTKKDFVRITESVFSSGQNIVFQLITRLVECIQEYSIVIFDEPETHLHPNIAGRLIRTIHEILKENKAYAILSTHSPIILQEIPSRYITVFDRKENYPIIYKPPIECFGENLSEISNVIFNADQEKELYKTQFEKFVDSQMSIDEIDQIFENRLSLNARLYIINKLKK